MVYICIDRVQCGVCTLVSINCLSLLWELSCLSTIPQAVGLIVHVRSIAKLPVVNSVLHIHIQARDILVLIILANQEQPFESPWREEFLADLGKITNTVPIVESQKLITRDELAALDRQLVIFPHGPVANDLL